MGYIRVDINGVKPFVSEQEMDNIWPQVRAAHQQLHAKKGPGNEFVGWLELPEKVDAGLLQQIKEVAEEIQANSRALVVVGIGGSYIGARAAIEMMGHSFHNNFKDRTAVLFAGHTISSDYHADLLDVLKDIDFSVNVISKSGTTTEPAIAFRILRQLLEKKYGQGEARKRIVATTDASRGALKTLADKEGYRTFVIPDDIGGRYSVLTPVGLLPMAVAGIDIKKVLAGARKAQQELKAVEPENPCYLYAAIRNILYRKGMQVELLAAYHLFFQSFGEWWKQLFGESEGKDGKGLFPAAVTFSTDLHSLGQYIQDGPRVLFETVLTVEKSRRQVKIPSDAEDLDKLNYLQGRDLDFVNKSACQGTVMAHVDGGVPNILLAMPEVNEEGFGYLVYFMMKACAISGYLLGVNPFDQPGVEAYKGNMFELLGKPR